VRYRVSVFREQGTGNRKQRRGKREQGKGKREQGKNNLYLITAINAIALSIKVRILIKAPKAVVVKVLCSFRLL